MMKNNGWSFELNYLRIFQFKADKVEAKIEQHEALNEELIFFKQQIADIKDDAGDNGLDRDDRRAIHQNLDSIGDLLHEIEKLPELTHLTERLDYLDNKIQHHAEMWGIDSW